MGKLGVYLELCRVGNLPTIWTNVLAASLLATGNFAPGQFLLLAASLSCFYMAGMSLNDVCDAAHDRKTKPLRPIPSGRISTREAGVLTAVLFIAAMLALTVAPHPRGIMAGSVLLLAIVGYDLRHKGNPLSVLLMAACRLLVFAVVSLALTGALPAPLLMAGSVQFAYVVAISLVARHENARPVPFRYPVVPVMLAGICLLDGLLMAVLLSPPWLAAGLAGFGLTLAGQRAVRGD